MVEDALPLPPVVPFPQPSGNFPPLAEVNLDTSIEFSDLASRLFAFNHLTEVESNFSAISLDRPSSSTSSSFDLPASSSASSISYTYLDSSFLPTYYPSQVLSSSPLPMLDSSDYFAALQSAPSISTTSFDSFDLIIQALPLLRPLLALPRRPRPSIHQRRAELLRHAAAHREAGVART
ncbi:hypothetical protein BCR35DRAFT_298221, partial [Leucosporidium creatinivorum]